MDPFDDGDAIAQVAFDRELELGESWLEEESNRDIADSFGQMCVDFGEPAEVCRYDPVRLVLQSGQSVEAARSTVQKRPLQPAPTRGADFFNKESSDNKAEAREEKLISRASARNVKAEIKKKLRTAKSANRQKTEGEGLKGFSNYAGTHLPIVYRVPQWL